MLRRRTCMAAGAGLALMGGRSARGAALDVLRADGLVFERAYFGQHLHHADRIAWPAAGFGAWRLWDAGISWADIEREPGRLDFTRLDALLALAARRRVEVVLPIALTPAWASQRPDERSAYGPGRAAPPRNLADWAAFVARLVQHTRGRVQAYEVWNEANVSAFFTGEVQTLVAMTALLREAIDRHAPGALLLAPSGAGLLDPRRNFVARFVEAGGGRTVDALNFHLYTGPHPPEVMVQPVRELLAVAARAGPGLPLWNTESGYWLQPGHAQRGARHNDAMPVERAAAYMVRSHIVARALGIERYFAYAWDNADLAFVLDDMRTPNAVGQAYAAMTGLLTGARLRSCSVQRNGPCTAGLEGADGRGFMLAWASGAPLANWRPPGVAAVSVATLDGRTSVARTERIDLHDMPVVLRRHDA